MIHKVIIIFLPILMIGCAMSKKDGQSDQSFTSSLSVKMKAHPDTFAIFLTNNTSDTVFIPPEIGFNGYDLYTTDESGELVHDTRGRNISVRPLLIKPNETRNLTQNFSTRSNGWSYNQYFMFYARVKKSSHYTINFEIKKHNIHENITVYFNYEKAMTTMEEWYNK